MTFPVEQKTTKKNAWQMPNLYLCTQGDFENHNGHLLVLVLNRSGILSVQIVHKVSGTEIAEKMILEFGESRHPVFRATSPFSRGQLKSKGHGKLSIHYLCRFGNDLNCFSHNYFCKSAQSLRSSRRNV